MPAVRQSCAVRCWARRWVVAFLASVALLAPASTAQTQALGLPMWVVRDTDSTIYITGTVHLLPDGLTWRSEKLDSALAGAQELYLELAEIADPQGLNAKVMPVVEENARWDGPPLSTMLTSSERRKLAEALERANAPAEIVAKTEKLQPWYAAYALGREQFSGGGFKSKNGVDNVLARIAVDRGIPVKGMEEIQDQIALMTGETPDQQVSRLRALLAMPDEWKRRVERVNTIAYGAWARGEINAVEGLAILMSASPGNDALLLDRNEKWAAKIETMLAGSGVTFIAVGAAHLVGPDSLVARLKLRGIRAERY